MSFQNVEGATKNINQNFKKEKLKRELKVSTKTFNVISKC